MTESATCPGCGASITFRSERAPYSVCTSCGHMLVRRELGLELLGRVAECQPDGTLIQIGTRGAHQGRGFSVLGRVQLVYGDGFWNEWFLALDDGRSGWLGEAMGQYFLCQDQPWEENPRLLSPPLLGEVEWVAGRSYAVLDSKVVRVGSYEGELPYAPPVGVEYASVDLRSVDGEGVTVSYLSDPPSLSVGRWLTFSDLALSGLREDEAPGVSVPSGQVRSLNCAGCGAPFELATGAQSRTYACQYCGSQMDSRESQVVALGEVVDRARELADRSILPLGSELRLSEGPFRLIGFLEASTTLDEVVYPWTEYLLYNRWHGYRWLSLSEGHLTLFSPLAGVPSRLNGEPVGRPKGESLRSQDRLFRHFQTSQVTTGRVVGEFYWRLRSGESSVSRDYVSPPYLLSSSSTGSDITWSLGRYLSREEREALSPHLASRRDSWTQAPHQPNPHQPERYAKVFWLTLAAALILLVSGALLPEEKLIWRQQAVPLTRTGVQVQQTLPPVKGNVRLEVSSSDLPEGFVELHAEVVSQGAGSGPPDITALVRKGDFSRSRGEMYFGGFTGRPAVLKLTPTFGPAASFLPPLRPVERPGTDSVRCRLNLELYRMRPSPPIGSFFLLVLLLALPPGLALLRRNEFEKRRWAESDYG